MLSARGVRADYGGDPVLRGVDLDLGPGVTAVIGANGSGKSTLLRCLAGIMPHAGTVALDGAAPDLRRGAIAYLPQEPAAESGLSVAEVVLLGLLPDLGWRVGADQERRVAERLAASGLSGLARRGFDTLSGGQRQIVLLAQALVREPAAILLDEPTNHLDIVHQLALLRELAGQARAHRRICAIAIHDLNLAARWCDRIAVLHQGRIAACGPPDAILTPELLAEVFAIEVEIVRDRRGRPIAVPCGGPPPPAPG